VAQLGDAIEHAIRVAEMRLGAEIETGRHESLRQER
jgi:hypothetical protein